MQKKSLAAEREKEELLDRSRLLWAPADNAAWIRAKLLGFPRKLNDLSYHYEPQASELEMFPFALMPGQFYDAIVEWVANVRTVSLHRYARPVDPTSLGIFCELPDFYRLPKWHQARRLKFKPQKLSFTLYLDDPSLPF